MAELIKYFGKGIPVSAGFDLNAKTPLDSRTVVADLEQLNSMDTIKIYNGLKVFVESEQAEYVYKISSYNKVLNEETQEVESTPIYGWVKEVSSGDVSKVSEELTAHKEAYETKVASLEAKDTSISESITTIENKITSLEAKDTELAGNISQIANDLTAHSTANDTKFSELDSEDDRLEGLINDLSTTVNDLSNLHNEEIAAIETAYKAADTTLETKLSTNITNLDSKLNNEVSTLQAEDTRLAGLIQTNANDIDTLESSINTVITQVNANASSINILNGDINTEGSVVKAIADNTSELQGKLDENSSKKVVMENVTVTDGQTVINFGNIIPEGYSISKDAVKLHINGLTYSEVLSFILNKDSRVITWTMTSSNSGFDLESDDTCIVEYTIVKYNNVGQTNLTTITNIDEIKTTNGVDFSTSPDTYEEYIDLSEYEINDFMALVINGVQYTTEDYVVYNNDTKILTLKGVNTKTEDTIKIMDSVTTE